MGANDELTKRDTALGGKVRCEGCGGEWWLSGPQADACRESGDWGTKCGNNAAFPALGSRDDCTDETELTFVPYDVEENAAKLIAAGNPEGAASVREQAAAILAGLED